MTSITFMSTIKIRGINPYIYVSAARANRIKPSWRKPLPVLVRINAQPTRPWRINMMPTGDGAFYLYLHGSVREVSNTQVGDRVRVEISFDVSYKNGPQHRMPSWFKEALARNKKATASWRLLPPSRKKEILRNFATLKSDEARARNLKKALLVLSGNKGRFMARDWNEGR
jgi:hypothetical protein